jgi:hypothetical protein
MLAFTGHGYREQARYQGFAHTAFAADHGDYVADITEFMRCLMHILLACISPTRGTAGTAVMITFFSHC